MASTKTTSKSPAHAEAASRLKERHSPWPMVSGECQQRPEKDREHDGVSLVKNCYDINGIPGSGFHLRAWNRRGSEKYLQPSRKILFPK
jgi:hypothetical protein